MVKCGRFELERNPENQRRNDLCLCVFELTRITNNELFSETRTLTHAWRTIVVGFRVRQYWFAVFVFICVCRSGSGNADNKKTKAPTHAFNLSYFVCSVHRTRNAIRIWMRQITWMDKYNGNIIAIFHCDCDTPIVQLSFRSIYTPETHAFCYGSIYWECFEWFQQTTSFLMYTQVSSSSFAFSLSPTHSHVHNIVQCGAWCICFVVEFRGLVQMWLWQLSKEVIIESWMRTMPLFRFWLWHRTYHLSCTTLFVVCINKWCEDERRNIYKLMQRVCVRNRAAAPVPVGCNVPRTTNSCFILNKLWNSIENARIEISALNECA